MPSAAGGNAALCDDGLVQPVLLVKDDSMEKYKDGMLINEQGLFKMFREYVSN